MWGIFKVSGKVTDEPKQGIIFFWKGENYDVEAVKKALKRRLRLRTKIGDLGLKSGR